ncbi:hypothetical protein DSO57_1038449 [Entomophthora muscae]|uniref:Uncharacterized protein n=1 Tax=Entomophthora muscae TaxID=34485 RepID=A0ACC2RPN7_9FUNG|nr:hypothetical protein DSO57_1038449 [Entomophthora muscae]
MGIEGASSAPYCPEINGMVERANGTLVVKPLRSWQQISLLPGMTILLVLSWLTGLPPTQDQDALLPLPQFEVGD